MVVYMNIEILIVSLFLGFLGYKCIDSILMPVINTSTKPTQSPLTKSTENIDKERVTFLPNHQQNLKKASMNTIKNPSSTASMNDRTPSNLLELKQQRLLAAADRKKRLITRIITVVGVLIILLCAAIVTFTLKMAPKIDELVRTKTGTHQSVHIMSRMTTPLTTMTIVLNNFTTNSP
jgi:hypothetical protein